MLHGAAGGGGSKKSGDRPETVSKLPYHARLMDPIWVHVSTSATSPSSVIPWQSLKLSSRTAGHLAERTANMERGMGARRLLNAGGGDLAA